MKPKFRRDQIQILSYLLEMRFRRCCLGKEIARQPSMSRPPPYDNTIEINDYLKKYAYTIGLRRRDWAWEFLRRNPRFLVEAYAHFLTVQRSISCIADSKVLHLYERCPLAETWGLMFFPNAEDAGTTVPAFPPIPMTTDAFNALLDGGTLPVYRCDETDQCLRPTRADIIIPADEGFRIRVDTLLGSITDKARTRTALTQEEIDFVNLAPMPVYKMLVVHTQYNNQAGNPLSAYSDVIAGVLVVEYLERGLDAIEEALKAEGRISVYDSEQVQSTITSVRAKLRNRRAIAATEIGGWLAVMEQTQTLERIIAGRLSVDMQGSLRFAEVVQAR